MRDLLFTLQKYALELWDVDYIQLLVYYFVYIIIVFFALFPLLKRALKWIVSRTETSLDDELYDINKHYIKFLFALFWFVLIHYISLKFVMGSNQLYLILYALVLTSIYIILYIMLHKSTRVIMWYLRDNYSWIITKDIENFIKIIIDVFFLCVTWLLILTVWGINTTPLLASAWIFGIAIAMASKNIIENFLSWMIIFADKNINLNDTVVLDDWTFCSIQEINIRTTILRTTDWDVVILPNSVFLNQKVINKSLSEISKQKRVSVTIWVSYWDDSQKAKDLLISYMKELNWADKESVVAFVDNLWDWSVNVTARAMVNASDRSYLMQYQIVEKAYNDFPKNWLNFPFPTYSIDSDLPQELETKIWK